MADPSSPALIELVGGGSISPMVRKVEYALRLKGIAYEPSTVDSIGKPPELFEINPLGQVPAIRHGEFVIGGSSIICEYLDSVVSTPLLVPRDPWLEARCGAIARLADGDLWDAVRSIWLTAVVRPIEGVPIDDDGERLIAIARTDIAALSESLAPLLGDSTFALGPELSLADLCLAAVLTSLEHAGHPIETMTSGATGKRVEAYVGRLRKVQVINEVYSETANRIAEFW